MSTSATETTTQLAPLPRVNLLPPEIEQDRRAKRVRTGLGVGVLAAVGVVGALTLSAGHQVASAQDDVDAQQARTAQLNAETKQYAEVPVVYAAVDAAQAQLTQAMGSEIRWSYFLNDLSLATPNKVWLTSMTVTPADPTAVAGASAPGTTPDYLQPGIGTVTFLGKGYRHNDVAAWLLALAHEKGLTQPYFTSSKVDPVGDQDAVTFTSQATITKDALSGRYSTEAGS
jgi:Tfp pilus assembly protein PilN